MKDMGIRTWSLLGKPGAAEQAIKIGGIRQSNVRIHNHPEIEGKDIWIILIIQCENWNHTELVIFLLCFWWGLLLSPHPDISHLASPGGYRLGWCKLSISVDPGNSRLMAERPTIDWKGLSRTITPAISWSLVGSGHSIDRQDHPL
jgi:hypothetical protein